MTNGNALPAGYTTQADRPRAPAVLGTPDVYRENIYGLLAGAEGYARIGASYAELANDDGLDHAIRCLVAQTRAAVNLLADLKAMTADLAQRPKASAERQR